MCWVSNAEGVGPLSPLQLKRRQDHGSFLFRKGADRLCFLTLTRDNGQPHEMVCHFFFFNYASFVFVVVNFVCCPLVSANGFIWKLVEVLSTYIFTGSIYRQQWSCLHFFSHVFRVVLNSLLVFSVIFCGFCLLLFVREKGKRKMPIYSTPLK